MLRGFAAKRAKASAFTFNKFHEKHFFQNIFFPKIFFVLLQFTAKQK
jgi:hypothetical protein